MKSSLIKAVFATAIMSLGLAGRAQQTIAPVTALEWAYVHASWPQEVRNDAFIQSVYDVVHGKIVTHMCQCSVIVFNGTFAHHEHRHCYGQEVCVICNPSQLAKAAQLQHEWETNAKEQVDLAYATRMASAVANGMATVKRARANEIREDVQDRLDDQRAVTVYAGAGSDNRLTTGIIASQTVTGRDVKDMRRAQAMESDANLLDNLSAGLAAKAQAVAAQVINYFWFHSGNTAAMCELPSAPAVVARAR